MRVGFLLLDVFAETPLTGNQLCVVPDGEDLPPELMQPLANEVGLSETTFVVQHEPTRYRMRIFTPARELPFAGHPSLGTAFCLRSLRYIEPRVTQVVEAGEYLLEVDLAGEAARMHQGTASLGAMADRARIASALGLRPEDLRDDLPAQVVSTGLPHLMVPARSEGAVRRARPRNDAVAEIADGAGADGLYLFAHDGKGSALARFFGPSVGVDEDPATGSAAGPLGAYLFAHTGRTGELVIRQGEQLGRPSLLRVEASGDRFAPSVIVSGHVRVVGHGAFEVPWPPAP